MTAPTLTPAEVERALAAITSLAIVARSLPIAAVREHVLRDRDEAAAGLTDVGAPPRALEVLLGVVEACETLGRAGDELDRAIHESRRSTE